MVGFENLSPNPEAAWFADAMSDEVLALLVRLPGVSVAARLPRTTPDARDAARQLGAELLLQGSARREEGRFRLRSRLLDVVTGSELWTRDVDQPLSRILEGPGQAVAGLGGEAVKPPTGHAEAYDSYLRGRALLAGAAYGSAALALAKAVELDPNFAPAYALLSQVRSYHYRYIRPDPGALDLAAAAADQALRLAPNLPESLVALAILRACHGNWDEALHHATKALEQRPNDPWTQVALSWVQTWRQPPDPEQVRGHAEEALRLAPELGPAYAQLARGLILAGRHTEADAALQRAAALLPGNFLPRLVRAEYHLSLREYPQARQELDTTLFLTPEAPLPRFYLACLQAAEDPTAELLAACEAAGEDAWNPFCVCSRSGL
jgi:tetratricopeptide (TPR) repeat protein